MSEPRFTIPTLTMPEKLALAQKAYQRFYLDCFWYMREDLQVGEENLASIVHGLCVHGNREAFFIADKLCR